MEKNIREVSTPDLLRHLQHWAAGMAVYSTAELQQAVKELTRRWNETGFTRNK